MARTKINKTVARIFTGLHGKVYTTTGGKVGGKFEADGAELVVLHHRGAKTSQARQTPLVAGVREDDWILVASYSGHDTHPAWYHNLVANPSAVLQVGADRIDVLAKETSGEERQELWDYMVNSHADYADYERVTERHIPVFQLTRR